MPLWSSIEAIKATGGKCTVSWNVEGISIDTRTVQPGDLFIALKDKRDGHEFVEEAFAKGIGVKVNSSCWNDAHEQWLHSTKESTISYHVILSIMHICKSFMSIYVWMCVCMYK